MLFRSGTADQRGKTNYNQQLSADRCQKFISDLKIKLNADKPDSVGAACEFSYVAVGESYWPTYFQNLRDRLRSGGVGVLQVITIAEDRFGDYRSRPDFIQKYIFPGGMLPTMKIIERQTAKAGLKLVAKELFGDGYARTLEEWRRRFLESWPAIEALGFDERFKRNLTGAF